MGSTQNPPPVSCTAPLLMPQYALDSLVIGLVASCLARSSRCFRVVWHLLRMERVDRTTCDAVRNERSAWELALHNVAPSLATWANFAKGKYGMHCRDILER